MTAALTEAPEVLAMRDAVIVELTAVNAVPLTLQQIKALGKDLPPYYTEVVARLRFGGPSRLNGHLGANLFGIDTRVVSAVEDTTYTVLEDIDSRLRNARLTIGDAISTPVLFESSDSVEDDEGRWSSLWTWTTTIKNRRAS